MSKTLQQKNTRSLLMWLPLVMLAASVFLYLLMRAHIHHMQEQQLQLKQSNIWNSFIATPGGIPLHIQGEYTIEKGSPAPVEWIDHQRDTALDYTTGHKRRNFTILTKQYTSGKDTYQVTTYFSSTEITHLIIKIGLAEACIFLMLLGAIVIINRKTSRRLWTPFYNTMEHIKNYDIQKNKPLSLATQTPVNEFNQLNQTLIDLIDYINKAYHNQKQFTENASHELQTPLAIIRSKVELLMDNPALAEENAALLADINEANERLSQMNKNLLLLTKIDNNQFPEQQTICISSLLERSVGYYREYYEGVLPEIKTAIEPDVFLQANASLIEVLVNNLLRNAIMHNIPGGYIHIGLTRTELNIENTGPILEGDPQRLFERFEKGRDDARTTGLGLALVRQICRLYHFEVIYHYRDGVHRIQIIFSR